MHLYSTKIRLTLCIVNLLVDKPFLFEMQLSFYSILQEITTVIFTHIKYFNCLLA